MPLLLPGKSALLVSRKFHRNGGTLQINATKAKLKAGQTVYGCFVRYPDASFAEVLGYQGWDFLVFDGEHGTIEPRDCENLVRAAELRKVTPIVRVPANSPPVILRYMDTGAQGVHVPWVNSAEEARAVVRSVKYQPLGNRGLAAVRAADYGQQCSLAEYVRQANAETLVVIHIETAEAIPHLPEILAVEGIDVIFIGPTDLAHSLGEPGNPRSPKVKAATEEIANAVLRSDRALGIMVGDAPSAREWKDRGARYITVTVEAIFCPAAQTYLKTVHS